MFLYKYYSQTAWRMLGIQVLYPSSKNSDQILVHPISKINSSFFGVNVTFCLHDYIPKKNPIV